MDSATNMFLMGLLFLGTVGIWMAVQRALTPPKKEEGGSLSDLVKDKASKGASIFDKLDPNGGLLDKIDLLLAKNVGLQDKLELMHLRMGSPDKPTALDMLHTKELVSVVVPILLAGLTEMPVLLLAAPICFMLPDVLYAGKIQKRQQQVLGNFPTMVDLAALIIESGLDYMTAFDRIVKITPNQTALEEELGKMLHELQLGYSRRDSLRRLAMRVDLQEINSFVGLIIQSDELGTSLVELLRNFAADMRFRRLNRAEQLAAQASTKMLIPLFVFIFPTVFILMLAPMVMDLLKGGLPF
jgi:tight adherence protein C